MLTGVYETLRSAGRELKLELGQQARVADRLVELQAAARELAADPAVTEKQLASANAALALGSNPAQLLDLAHCSPRPVTAPPRSATLATGSSRPRSTSSPRATGSLAGAARPLRRRVRRREAA